MTSALVDIQAKTLGQAHDPGEIVFLLLARVAGDDRVDPTLPPGGTPVEVRHRQVAAVAKGRSAITGRAMTIHQHVKAVHRQYIVRKRQMTLERPDQLVVDHQHFYPGIVEQMQGPVDPIDVCHDRIGDTGVTHVGDAQLKRAAMQD
ncbi:hypothetical protein D3C71_1771930 [compost metagenome]